MFELLVEFVVALCCGEKHTHKPNKSDVKPAGVLVNDKFPISAAEAMFSKMPLRFGSYPILCFTLRKFDESLMRTSLAKALQVYPKFAGRLDIRGQRIVLDERQGVPFSVVSSTTHTAPERVEESLLPCYARLFAARDVMRGEAPLMAVKITVFRDGTAVLAFSRSHSIMDGSSAWAFLAHWALCARGEQVPDTAGGSLFDQHIPITLPEVQKAADATEHAKGRTVRRKHVLEFVMKQVLSTMRNIMDKHFMKADDYSGLHRRVIFFSNDEVAAIKAAASPPPGTPGDGWITTQDALAAYILQTIARAVLPENSQGRASLKLWLDARKCLGIQAGAYHGFGLIVVSQQISGNILKKSLWEVAVDIHEGSVPAEQQKQLWRVGAGCAHLNMFASSMAYTGMQETAHDVELLLNNQSKRVMPSWGEATGGAPTSVATNAGPTLLLPFRDGVNLYLSDDMLKKFPAELQAKALSDLRGKLPKLLSS
eukprot:TRINITY_DN75972_c0_g1_i1.p1 TRINITY_DN75972_c0_g1~~TRINITY_DN75972_c0_g1_i1.p1  ORF type:complete len:483 (+),score=69.38 TRINITY_DN75972_c0_g1_i1:76-1524(+)